MLQLFLLSIPFQNPEGQVERKQTNIGAPVAVPVIGYQYTATVLLNTVKYVLTQKVVLIFVDFGVVELLVYYREADIEMLVRCDNTFQDVLVSMQHLHDENKGAVFVDPNVIYVFGEKNVKKSEGILFFVYMFDGVKIHVVHFVLYLAIVRKNVEKVYDVEHVDCSKTILSD